MGTAGCGQGAQGINAVVSVSSYLRLYRGLGTGRDDCSCVPCVYMYICVDLSVYVFVKRCGLSKPPAFERTSSLKVLACRHGEMLH